MPTLRKLGGAALLVVCACLCADEKATPGEPRFLPDGRLAFPGDYREWIYLSSGLGMTYNSTAVDGSDPDFDNVFVNRGAYRSYLESGEWPNGTTFVLEVRSSRSKGSINQGGHFQGTTNAVEVHVKDEKRFPDKWAFFGFEDGQKPARQIPVSASCYSCHTQHGAVDTTFVQFYPTLIDIARRKGTYHETGDGSAR